MILTLRGGIGVFVKNRKLSGSMIQGFEIDEN